MLRFEYGSGKGSCSLTHSLITGKAEHPGACDDEGPPPIPCCGGLRGQHAQTLCPDKAIPHLFVISIEPDDVDPGMVDVRALGYYLAHQGAEGTLQALCLPEGAIPQLGWYQLRALGEPVHAECQAAPQQDPDALPEARLQEIQSVHHRSGPDEDPDHDTRAHYHRGELLAEVQRLKKRLCQALQQHLADLQRAQDNQAQVFGELRGVVAAQEAQLASERARSERLMDRTEKLQGRLLEMGEAYLAKLESARGPDGEHGGVRLKRCPEHGGTNPEGT